MSEYTVKFTQFLRPDGKQVPVVVDRPADICALANELREAGCRFEIECLPGNVVNMDIQPSDGEGVFACELAQNGPEVLEAVDRLVKRAHEVWKKGPPWYWDLEGDEE